MIATKEQERKALEKIKKIINGLGEGSYLSTAFEGCVELAEDNIKNDFGCSLLQQVKAAQNERDKALADMNGLYSQLSFYKEDIEKANKRAIKSQTAKQLIDILVSLKLDCKIKAVTAADRIVQFADRPDSEAFTDSVAENRLNIQMGKHYEALIQELKRCTA